MSGNVNPWGWIVVWALLATPAVAEPAGAPALKLTFAGETELVFNPKRDRCDGHDVPDAPLRAYRGAEGKTIAFGLHFVNRALRGDTLDRIKIDCNVVLNSKHLADPAAYDDYNWITATWTNDGKSVDAIIHHEYHGNEHEGRCAFKEMMKCWYNTLVGYRSTDGGANFLRSARAPVVAAAAFTQDKQQGRHRGFFNPSNIVAMGNHRYFMASNTGWDGQGFGVCLFRTQDTSDPSSWRAWDGKDFSRRYGDPYGPAGTNTGKPCQPILPFQAPVGSVTRHAASGNWIAVYQAWKDDKYHPLAGLYYATSRNLTDWTMPRLLLAGATNYDDPCKISGPLMGYPSMLDPQSKSRNYDETGDSAQLYYVSLETKGCSITSNRDLLRRRVAIAPAK